MKRFLWIALIFGGGVMALMLASIILGHFQQKVKESGAASQADLKAAVTAVRRALADWDYEELTRHTSGVPRQAYQQMFDDAHGDNPDRLRKLKGMFSAMDAFPSIRFPKIQPERVDVNYEVIDETSTTRPAVSGVRKEGGFFLQAVGFPVASTENRLDAPIVFREGVSVSLHDTAERFFNSLASERIDDFLAMMMLENEPKPDATKLLNYIRTQVMTCHADRLKEMLPEVGCLPRGTRWFRLVVVGQVDQKRPWLDMEVVPGDPVRVRRFRAGLIERPERREKPPVKPPGADNATP